MPYLSCALDFSLLPVLLCFFVLFSDIISTTINIIAPSTSGKISYLVFSPYQCFLLLRLCFFSSAPILVKSFLLEYHTLSKIFQQSKWLLLQQMLLKQVWSFLYVFFKPFAAIHQRPWNWLVILLKQWRTNVIYENISNRFKALNILRCAAMCDRLAKTN